MRRPYLGPPALASVWERTLRRTHIIGIHGLANQPPRDEKVVAERIAAAKKRETAKAEKAAAKKAADAAAAVAKAEEAAANAPASEADKKAARDARYAARKARR